MAISKEREERINRFLHIVERRSNEKFLTEEDIYSELTSYDISQKEQIRIDGLFQNWINDFKQYKNIDVFRADNWRYFCQFINDTNQNELCEDPIKIYVSLDTNHIYNGAKMIFRFLADNNIEHMSKIASHIRTDGIVMRIFDKNQAEKVIDFINNNAYLKEGQQNVNPFCFKKGMVGLAIDNYNSYNVVVANLILKYINEKKLTRTEKNISYNDFAEYVNNFNSYDKDFLKGVSVSDELGKVEYIEEIVKLISTSLKTDDIYYYFNHFYSVINNRKLKQKEEEKIVDIIKKEMLETIGNRGMFFTKISMKTFLVRGSTLGISKKSKVDFSKINYLEASNIIQRYTGANNIDEALDILSEPNMLRGITGIDLEIIKKAIRDTAEKYNERQSCDALLNYLSKGNTEYFTRRSISDEPCRSEVEKCDYNELRKKIIKIGIINNIIPKNEQITVDYLYSVVDYFVKECLYGNSKGFKR